MTAKCGTDAPAGPDTATRPAALGGGGGGGGDDVAPPPPPPGGSGTGADGVPVFWTVYDYNVANGFAYSVRQTADGGYILAGAQSDGFTAATPNDFYVVKTTATGVKQWSRRIPVSGGGIAYAVQPTADGGYLVAGTAGTGATATAVLIKLDAGGNTVAGWPKTYAQSGGSMAYALHAVNGGADGFLVAGFAAAAGSGNVYALRIDAAGAVLWEKFDYASFCPGGGGAGYGVTATTDGNFVIAGRTGCLGWAGILLKISSANGAEIWRQTFDGPTSASFADLVAVAATPDGGVVATGSVGSDCGVAVGGTCDALLIKTDSAGNETWRRTYGGAEKEGGYGVALAADGNYLVAGYSRSFGGAITDPAMAFMWADAMAIKVTPAGATVWHKVKGLRPRGADFVNALAVAADGGFVIGGSSGGNVMLAKFDKNGDTASLGANDLSVTVPTTQGVINFSNPIDVAGLGANALILPRELGGAMLDLLVAASGGAAPSAFCTGGGTYSFNPAVPATPTPVAYALSFANCVTGAPGDAIRINGSGTLTVDSISGTPSTGTYGLQVTVASLALVVDEPGTSPVLGQNFIGGLRIARTATGGNFADTLSSPVGVTLNAAETSGASVVRSAAYGPFSIRYTVPASGGATIGQAGDTATVTAGSDSFAVSVLTPIAMPASGQPTAGVYRVTAQDASRLTATLSGSSGADSTAALAIDANGDGTYDGTISVPWDFIY